MVKLIDTPYPIAGRIGALKGAGIVGAIRYLSPPTTNFPQKRLSITEVEQSATEGFWLGTVWEVMGDAAEMTSATGKAHGLSATTAALSAKQPAGSSIAFAVDYDAPQSDFAKISDYFEAVHTACRQDGYLVTGYGSEAVIKYLDDLGLIRYTWLAGSAGWSESRFATGETIDQTNAGNVSVAGLPCDLDELSGTRVIDPGKAGMWLPK